MTHPAPATRGSAAPGDAQGTGPEGEPGASRTDGSAALTAVEVPEELVKQVAEILRADYDEEHDTTHLGWRDFARQAKQLLVPILTALPEHDWIPPWELDEPLDEPDVCRPVEVDGEMIRVRGSGEPTEEDRQHFGSVIRAAKAAMEAAKAAERAEIEQEVRAKVAEELREHAAGYTRTAQRGGALKFELTRRAQVLAAEADRIARGGQA